MAQRAVARGIDQPAEPSAPAVAPLPHGPVLREVAEMWRFAHAAGIAEALHRPRLALSLGAALADWALIALATAATLRFGWVAVPLALLLIGNRQRALGNLLHDASHWSFDGERPSSPTCCSAGRSRCRWRSTATSTTGTTSSSATRRAIPTSSTTRPNCAARATSPP